MSMENNNNSKANKKSTKNSKRKTQIIIAGTSVGLIIAIAAFVQYSYTGAKNTLSTVPENFGQIQTTGGNNQEFREPPPRELSIWGKEVSSFQDAKAITGLTSTFASLPSHVPSGLEIASIRTNTSPGGNYLTVFYAPAGVTAKDNDTFEMIMKSGGMITVYSQEKVGPKYNQTKMIQSFLDEAPTVRHLSTTSTDNATTILIDGTPAKQIPSEVIIIYNQTDGTTKTMTDLVSLKYDSVELEKVAETILG